MLALLSLPTEKAINLFLKRGNPLKKSSANIKFDSPFGLSLIDMKPWHSFNRKKTNSRRQKWI